MKRYDAGQCDVAVIGAGHAGIEAALAAARLGMDIPSQSTGLIPAQILQPAGFPAGPQ